MRGVIGLVIVVVIVAIVWWRGRGTDDTVESMKIDYRITTDGIVHVRETIVYRFGSRSGRHGIYRNLIVRKHSGHPGKDVQYWSASAAQAALANLPQLLQCRLHVLLVAEVRGCAARRRTAGGYMTLAAAARTVNERPRPPRSGAAPRAPKG